MKYSTGEAVDCNGWFDGQATCKGGEISSGPDDCGDYFVKGKWSDDSGAHWVRPDQITRHVPAAPAKPRSVGDKLASEMTVRVKFTLEAMRCLIDSKREFNNVEQRAEWAVTIVDAHLAALDKAKGETP